MDEQNYKANRLSVIVYSCIRNSDMWEYFSISMDRYWENRNFPIILVTDRYEESDKWYFDKIVCVDSNWVNMISAAIKEADSEYIMLFMDDYLFTDKIDESRLENCMKIMDSSNALCIRLSGEEAVVELRDSKYEGVKEYPQRSAYCLSLHAGVWNSRYLLDLISNKAWSAWDFERIGSMEYEDKSRPILVDVGYRLPYIDGVRKGKWLSDGVKWCRENNIQLDFSRRSRFTLIERMIIGIQGILLHCFPNMIVKVQNKLSSYKTVKGN